MKIDNNNEIPLFIQIAKELSDSIIMDIFIEETQIPSVADLSTFLNINPATVLKGVNILVDDEIIYKKRGVGMFVKSGAKAKLIKKRKEQFYEMHIKEIIKEAKRLDIKTNELVSIIEGGMNNE